MASSWAAKDKLQEISETVWRVEKCLPEAEPSFGLLVKVIHTYPAGNTPLNVTITRPTPELGNAKRASKGVNPALLQVTMLPGVLNVPWISDGLLGPKVKLAMPAATLAGVTCPYRLLAVSIPLER